MIKGLCPICGAVIELEWSVSRYQSFTFPCGCRQEAEPRNYDEDIPF